MNELNELQGRVASLERHIGHLRLAVGVVCTVAALAVLGAWRGDPEDVIRARQFIVEDEEGRARMLIGRQSDFGGQRPPSIGMAINDTLGYERFGMGLRPNGRMSMGFDAPLGKGDDRNRERINIIADEDGGAEIRFLDRETFVKGRLSLTPDNRLVLSFLDFPPNEVRRRLIGFEQDTVVVERR